MSLLCFQAAAGGLPPHDPAFSLRQIELPIRQMDLSEALYWDTDGYPKLDPAKVDFEQPRIIGKHHQAVILENRYVRVTVLPEMGRIYSLVNKITGHEQLWTNAIAKPLTGQRNDTGWWMVWGGIEHVIPRGEHGTTWALPWKFAITSDNRSEKSVRMEVVEPKTRLRQTLEIALRPHHAAVETRSKITNTTRQSVRYSYWVNPMWAPGGKGELSRETELIVPCRSMRVADRDFNAWMLGERLQDFERNPLRWVKHWRSIGDLQAEELTEGFYGAFCHESNEGVVRVLDPAKMPGMNIWTWGYPPPSALQRQYSFEPNLGYVEMWGGTTRDFADESLGTLKPGASWESKEWMYACQGLGGLTAANREAAVQFKLDLKNRRLSLGIWVAAPQSDCQILVQQGRKTLMKERARLEPASPYLADRELMELADLENQPPVLVLRQGRKELLRTDAKPIVPLRWGHPYLSADPVKPTGD